MPNVALMIGAGLIGALFAGLYFLYTDEGFNNNHHEQHYNNARPPPPRNNGPRNRTNFPEGYDTPADANNRRRRRRDEEDENCVICCDEMRLASPSTIITLQRCGHKFHKKCLQQWVETDASSDTCPTCRLKISVRERELLISA